LKKRVQPIISLPNPPSLPPKQTLEEILKKIPKMESRKNKAALDLIRDISEAIENTSIGVDKKDEAQFI
jgi:hypothetical protein